MTTDGILEPSDSEVMQTESDHYPSFPVDINGPVNTRDLPCVNGGMRRVTFTDNTAQLVLSNNPVRARAFIKIITAGGIIHLGQNSGQAVADNAPQWAGTEPYESNCRDNLYVAAPTATAIAPIVISVFAENWTY